MSEPNGDPVAEGQQRGDTRIDVWLTDVTDTQIDFLMERICDVIVEDGDGLVEAGEDASVRALVGLRPVAFPDFEDDDATKAFLADYARFAIPQRIDD